MNAVRAAAERGKAYLECEGVPCRLKPLVYIPPVVANRRKPGNVQRPACETRAHRGAGVIVAVVFFRGRSEMKRSSGRTIS